MTEQEAREILEQTQYWHYPFDLPWGSVAPTRASSERHHLRREYLFTPLLRLCGGTLIGRRVLDLGCCQGFWSFAAAQAGASRCLGLDSSPTFVREAEALRMVFGYDKCEFRCAHLENDRWWDLSGVDYDVTFFLGLFYHLADPSFVLRRAMERTSRVIVIDTDVIRGREAALYFVARDPEEFTTRNSKVTTSVRTVPTRAALAALLAEGGFEHVEFLKPRRWMPREYRTGQRVSIIAWR